MAYGIQVFGPSASYTLLDSSIAMEGTVAVTTGSGTSVSYELGEILAIRKNVTSGNFAWIVGTRSLSGTTYTMSFVDGSTVSTAISVDYVILKPTKSITASGSYGHVTYASDGTTRTFDSRLFSSGGGFNITNVAPGGSYQNTNTLATYNDYEYFAAGWFWNYNSTGLQFKMGLNFANNNATWGTTVKYRSLVNVFGGLSYPDLESGTFWGEFI